jgi:hypothetical protein
MDSNLEWAEAPGNVLLPARSSGLSKDSIANVSQIVTLDRGLTTEGVGRISKKQVELVFAGFMEASNTSKAVERVALAGDDQQITVLSFKVGAATYLETTAAVESPRQSELNLVAETLNADLAAVRLLKAAGAFKEAYQ